MNTRGKHFWLRRPRLGAVIGDLVVDELYLRIWDCALEICSNPGRGADLGGEIITNVRAFLRTRPMREFKLQQLVESCRRYLRQIGIKSKSHTLRVTLMRENGVTLKRTRYGHYLPLTSDLRHLTPTPT